MRAWMPSRLPLAMAVLIGAPRDRRVAGPPTTEEVIGTSRRSDPDRAHLTFRCARASSRERRTL